MMESEFKYYAFISYTEVDEKWAKWLQKKLEYYHIPSSLCRKYDNLPKKIRPVFWYKHDLSGTLLLKSLVEELRVSKYLIVVCSPATAHSSWVNDEVSTFISLGKRDKIIPFVVDGEPYSSDSNKECLPPVLAEVKKEDQLRCINPSEQGKAHALVDLVATMFGIRFDELWQRHKRHRDKIYAVSLVVTFFICAFFAGLYEYNRPKYEYFSDYVDQWGIAKGIFPINEELASRKLACYRFKYKRIPFNEPNAFSWRLFEVSHINSSGTPVKHQLEEQVDRYTTQKFEYNKTSGKLIRINYFSETGQIELRHNISEREGQIANIVDLQSPSEEKGSAYMKTISGNLPYSKVSSQRTNATIKRYAYERNKEGYIIKKTFHRNNDDDLTNSIIADANGIYGFRYTLDSLGRIVNITYLDDEGNPCRNRIGIAGINYSYYDYGPLFSVEYIDRYGNLRLNERAFAKTFIKSDEYGNPIEQHYYDTRAEHCIRKDGGYSKLKIQYNDKMQISCVSYYDELNSPVCNKMGYFQEELKYDKKGYLIESIYYDVNHRKCYCKDGTSVARMKYNRNGNCTRISCYDTNEASCFNKHGYSILEREYDKNGRLVAEIVYDTSGKRTKLKGGDSKHIIDYNEEGLMKSIKFYDEHDKPIIHKDLKYFEKRMEYDEKGNINKISYFGIDGLPTYNSLGFSTIRCQYNANGLKVCEDYFDTDDYPTCDNDNVARIKLYYDDSGNCYKFECYNENYELHNNRIGYAICEHIYDTYGNCIRSDYYDSKGYRAMDILGKSGQIKAYDSNGNLIKSTDLGIDGTPGNNYEGYSTIINKYNEKGTQIETSYYDRNGYPCDINVNGLLVSKYKHIYDKNGNITEIQYLDENGILCNNNLGFAKKVSKFNNLGYEIESALYDQDNNLVWPKGCYGARVIRTYDNLGYVIRTIYFDESNKLILPGMR